MNWRTDPPNGWTALYRIIVLSFLTYSVWAHANNSNVPPLIPTIEDALGSAVVGR